MYALQKILSSLEEKENEKMSKRLFYISLFSQNTNKMWKFKIKQTNPKFLVLYFNVNETDLSLLDHQLIYVLFYSPRFSAFYTTSPKILTSQEINRNIKIHEIVW